jgi:GWxTD domain-containing protein
VRLLAVALGCLVSVQVFSQEMEVVYEYLLTPRQQEDFDKLVSRSNRSRFIDDFWRRLDPTPETAYNELREEFNRRLDLAAIYELPYMDGWRTDRGRVLILHGYPSEIRRSRFGPVSGSKYEIWVYRDSPDDPEPVEVIFEDVADTGEFVLRTQLEESRMITLERTKPRVIVAR